MTRHSIDVRDAARDDLTNHYLWLAREAGLDVAERMAASADAAIFHLAAAPGVGSPLDSDRAELADLRKWRIPGFPTLRIFYCADEEAVTVLRVLHTAQNWEFWLGGVDS